jgi:hypothetical protein
MRVDVVQVGDLRNLQRRSFELQVVCDSAAGTCTVPCVRLIVSGIEVVQEPAGLLIAITLGATYREVQHFA